MLSQANRRERLISCRVKYLSVLNAGKLLSLSLGLYVKIKPNPVCVSVVVDVLACIGKSGNPAPTPLFGKAELQHIEGKDGLYKGSKRLEEIKANANDADDL